MRFIGFLLMIFLLFGCGTKEKEFSYPAVGNSDATENFKLFTLSEIEKGVKIWELRGKSGDIYTEKNLAKVKEPLVLFFKNNKISSQINALNGDVDTNTKDIAIEGNIVVNSYTDRIKLTTQKMFYNNALNKFTSDEFVTIESPESITTGIGFEADPELKEVLVKKDVNIISKDRTKNDK